MVALAYAREYRFEAAGSPWRSLQFGQIAQIHANLKPNYIRNKGFIRSFWAFRPKWTLHYGRPGWISRNLMS
jgi:hypothetical protein